MTEGPRPGRSRSRLHLVLAVVLVGSVACSSCAGCQAAAPSAPQGRPVIARTFDARAAANELWPKVRGVAYRPATAEQTRALAELLDQLWRGVDAGASPQTLVPLAQRAHEAGMTLELWTVGGLPLWVVREPDASRAGHGIYLVRAQLPGAGVPVLLEAPHVYFDISTQTIAASMLFSADAPASFRGLFTNSLHRYQQGPTDRDKRDDNPADVAHNAEHPYQTATAAIVAAGPVTILQLHGFDGDQRDDDALAGVDVVVSAGRRDGSTPQSTAVAGALVASLRVVVARYPEDTKLLGGTTNVQARLVETVPSAHFVHVEMTADLRQALARDAGRCAALGRAIAAALAEASR